MKTVHLVPLTVNYTRRQYIPPPPKTHKEYQEHTSVLFSGQRCKTVSSERPPWKVKEVMKVTALAFPQIICLQSPPPVRAKQNGSSVYCVCVCVWGLHCVRLYSKRSFISRYDERDGKALWYEKICFDHIRAKVVPLMPLRHFAWNQSVNIFIY